MSNKLVKKSNLGDLSYSDLGLDVSFQILEAPYLEDGTKMLFKIDDVENFCAYNLNDFADFGSILLLRQNDTFFFACIDKAKNDIASGTNYVNKSGIYRVNEKGMESVFSKQYGTLTFLNQGDKVFDANFTKQLLDNSTIATQKNMPDYAGMAKAIEKNIQNIQNLSGNTYVNNFYIDGAQDTESILREIDKHLDKKIQAHDKKQVRDFKSLR